LSATESLRRTEHRGTRAFRVAARYTSRVPSVAGDELHGVDVVGELAVDAIHGTDDASYEEQVVRDVADARFHSERLRKRIASRFFSRCHRAGAGILPSILL
jgi:hypothetical protein